LRFKLRDWRHRRITTTKKYPAFFGVQGIFF
jgi:hypothetical protein